MTLGTMRKAAAVPMHPGAERYFKKIGAL